MPVPQNQGGTGILPVANNLERASCLFHNQAISCGTGKMPVPKWHNIYPDE
jgi:hypothetical protein